MTKAKAGDTRPFAAFEWMIALRYLRARRRQVFISVITLISILGVMVGVAALIVVIGVMAGAQEGLWRSFSPLEGCKQFKNGKSRPQGLHSSSFPFLGRPHHPRASSDKTQ